MRWIAPLLAAISLFTATAPAAADETRLHYLARSCAQGQLAASLEQRANTSYALGDRAESGKTWKRTAQIWYSCAQDTSDSHLHDNALLAYGSDLMLSAVTNGDVLRLAPIVISSTNDLAYATRFEDVRAAALHLKSIAKAELASTCDYLFPASARENPYIAVSPECQ